MNCTQCGLPTEIVIASSDGCPDCGGPTTFHGICASSTVHEDDCPRLDPEWPLNVATCRCENPWVEAHVEAETAFQGSRARARRLVRNEYDGAPKPIPCVGVRCVGSMWYRATVGAMKCPDCGSLATSYGRVISDKS